MKKFCLSLCFLFAVFFSLNAQTDTMYKKIDVCLNANERKLYELVMQYRVEKGLTTIPLSASLSFVAKTHCKDLVENFVPNSNCNMHSWSAKGNWTPCCYTPNHAQARAMWNKPSELTNYKGNGYEIAFRVWSSGNANYTATPEEALEGWKNSSGHNDVILNKNIWNDIKWNAIGIGIYKGFAVIWFGAEEDVEPIPMLCN